MYGRKGQGLHLPIPGSGSKTSRCHNTKGYDGHPTLKGHVKNPLLQCSRRPARSVRNDKSGVAIIEVGHELVRRLASVMPRRSEDESLHADQIQKNGDRLRVPSRMLHPDLRPAPKIVRKTRCPPLQGQGARLVPLAKDIVRVDREFLGARYPNGHGQTQHQQVPEPEETQAIPVDKERNPEYERHTV